MEETADILNAINNLITTLINAFGAVWTVVIIFVCTIGVYLWKRYNNNKKESVYNKLIAEKDDTIARMKEEVKMYRIHIFKEQGWSEDEIDKYIK